MSGGALSLARLLQLASPALPVGAYSYSQAQEWAIECGWVHDEASAARWIRDTLQLALFALELPLLHAALEAWRAGDHNRIIELNEQFLASRESAEFYQETRQMGYSMLRLIDDLQLGSQAQRTLLLQQDDVAFPIAWALAAAALAVDSGQAVLAYGWGWLENQVMAAIKAVPLGQLAGQRLLLHLGDELAQALPALLSCPPTFWNTCTPGLAIASCRHETQYSRIFRS